MGRRFFVFTRVVTEESRLHCFPTAKVQLSKDIHKYIILINVNRIKDFSFNTFY